MNAARLTRNFAAAGAMNAVILARLESALVAKKPAVAEKLPENIPAGLGRILRPAAATRWSLPSVAAITPQYIEMVLRAALAGDHARQWELFDLMLDTWPELAACQQELVEGVMGRKRTFEAFAEEGEQPTETALERERLVSRALRGMRPAPTADEADLDGTIKDILGGWFQGVTVQEVLWHVAPTRTMGPIVAPRATCWVHPQHLAWTQEGTLGLRNADSRSTVVQPLPPHKFLVGIHKAKSGSALGASLLRPLAWWWCAANFASDWVLNLAQVFGLPFRWANYDPNAPQATVDAICSMLQNMGSAGWAAFPAGTTLELKDTAKGSDHSPQGELLDRADRYARLVILGQTQSGGKGSGVGGQAFGKVEADVKAARIEAASGYVCGVLGQLARMVLELNYGDAEECPEILLIDAEDASLERAQTLQALGDAGVRIGQKYARGLFDIPEPDDDEEVFGGPKAEPEKPDAGKSGKGEKGRDAVADEEEEDLEAKAAPVALLARLSRIEDDEALLRAISVCSEALEAGDRSGHPFRGNQWVTVARRKIRHVLAAADDDESEAVVETYHAVTAAEAARLKEDTALDVAGYDHAIDNYAVRHIRKAHGGESERERGQIPVTDADFARLPEIVTAYDKAEAAGKTKQGRETIRYEKRIGDDYFLVEEVRTKRKTLVPVTFYKRRATPDAQPGPRSNAQDVSHD